MHGNYLKQKAKAKKSERKRFLTLSVCAVLCFLLFFGRCFDLQYIRAEKYRAQASGITSITVPIKAIRGEILDYYGRPIATNREGYNIIFNYSKISKSTLNDTIFSLIKLVKNTKWQDDLPLKATYPYSFTDDTSAVSRMLSILDLAHYATAENAFDEMVNKYSLEGRPKSEQRLIMGVRYTMERAGFSISSPFIFAEDVSSKVMTVISENPIYSSNGVLIEIASFREYDSSSVAPHIIGNVSPIYAEDWEALKEKGYSYNDKIGRSGIEKACEDQLRGKDGEITYSIDSMGKILSSRVTKEPENGHSIRLTLDKTVQISAQNALKDTIKKLNSDKIYVNAGAAVAINIKTGGVIASVNYPSYTYDQYKNSYSKLSTNSSKPLFDRAFNGTYPPGSTFKPAVAAAALQEGVITTTESIFCSRTYKFYDDYQPHCMHYHGSTMLNNALAKSCNYYFFETGRRLGITKMNNYCLALGLGSYTGVEVVESKGVLAGPNSRKDWYGGNTLSAAIGQSDNAFTPLQLAVYTSAIANSGVRYKATLIDSITNYTQDKVLSKSKPTVMDKIALDENVIKAVKAGMLSVTEDGTGSATFKDYPITVGGKTGTAETPKGADHTVFIAFAPYDDPEIAVSVVIEHGRYGIYSGGLVKAIFNSYFFTDLKNNSDLPTYELLP